MVPSHSQHLSLVLGCCFWTTLSTKRMPFASSLYNSKLVIHLQCLLYLCLILSFILQRYHMAHQDIEGWPLGLRPLNARVGGLMRNLDFSVGSISFNTLLTSSPTTSTVSSSDLDTQSTGSFFHDKSKTLGSLIGVSSILELSRRSTRGTPRESLGSREKKMSLKAKPWLFSLCSKLTTDAVITNTKNTPSLGHFLEAERRAVSSTTTRRANHSPIQYGPNDYSPVNPSVLGSNSLFVNGLVAPNPSVASNGTKTNTHLLEDDRVFGVPLLFPRLCG